MKVGDGKGADEGFISETQKVLMKETIPRLQNKGLWTEDLAGLLFEDENIHWESSRCLEDRPLPVADNGHPLDEVERDAAQVVWIARSMKRVMGSSVHVFRRSVCGPPSNGQI